MPADCQKSQKLCTCGKCFSSVSLEYIFKIYSPPDSFPCPNGLCRGDLI